MPLLPPLFFGSPIFFFKVLGVSAYARRKFSSKWDCVGLIFCRCFCFCFCLRLRVGKGICCVHTQHRAAPPSFFSTLTQHMLSFFARSPSPLKIFVPVQSQFSICSMAARINPAEYTGPAVDNAPNPHPTHGYAHGTNPAYAGLKFKTDSA